MSQYFPADSTKLYQYKAKWAIQKRNVGQWFLTKQMTKMSESTLQVNFKKLPAAKYWYNTKEEYLWLFEKAFVIPFPFPPSISVRQILSICQYFLKTNTATNWTQRQI